MDFPGRPCRLSMLVGLSFLLTPAYLLSSAPQLKFTHLNFKEGLSQSMVYASLKDRQGFMWFATQEGLNLYDGYQFYHFNNELDNPNSLSDKNVTALCEDRQGNIWVGTNGGGLNKMTGGGKNFTRFRHDSRNPGSIIYDSIRAICEDRRGNLWVGTDHGLDCRLAGQETFVHFRADPGSPNGIADTNVNCLAEDSNGLLWAGTDQGLACYIPATGRFTHYRHSPADPATIDHNSVSSIYIAEGGGIWVGTLAGLNSLDPATGKVTRWLRDQGLSEIIGINTDRAANLWIGTRNDGLFRLDHQTQQLNRYRYDQNDPEGLSTNSLLSLYIDSTGILWVGTNGFGIDKANLEYKKFNNIIHRPGDPNSMNFNSVRSIYECNNHILLIGGYGGLDRFDRNSGIWQHFMPGGTSVRAICPESAQEDRFWIGTELSGLFLYDVGQQTVKPFPIKEAQGNIFFSVCQDPNGILWFGTNLGLNRYDPRTKETRYYNLNQIGKSGEEEAAAVEVKCLYEDKSSRLWIGTTLAGLFSYERQNDRFKRFSHDPNDPTSLSSGWVLCVYEDTQGRLWVGSNGGGLNLLDRSTGHFAHFTTKDGLPNNVVYAILEDKGGNLWLSTNLGIAKFDPATRMFKNFSVADGLIGNEFNTGAFHKSQWSGEMFFGGVNGITALFPEEINDNPYVPSVFITDFKLFNRSVIPGAGSVLKKPISKVSEITLKHSDSMLTFEFIGLHFAAPEKNLFAYRMEGFDHDWVYTDAKRRYATYTNLNPGTYVFQVKAANCDGIWNEKSRSIKITIVPPFWQTWWFYLLSGLTGALIILVIHERRVKQLKKRKAELEQLVEQRTVELKEASLKDPLTGLRNRRFITEILEDDISSFVNYKKYLLENEHRRKELPSSSVYGMFMLDVDHFKSVNDTYGHEAGDMLLVQFSKILLGSVRQDDVVIRMGGEEFLVVLKKTDPEYVDQFALRLKNKIGATDFIISKDGEVTTRRTCSIGYACFPFYRHLPDRLSFEQTINLADLGLYHAKNSGRNRTVHILPTDVQPTAAETVQFLSSIDYALEHNLLKVSID